MRRFLNGYVAQGLLFVTLGALVLVGVLSPLTLVLLALLVLYGLMYVARRDPR